MREAGSHNSLAPRPDPQVLDPAPDVGDGGDSIPHPQIPQDPLGTPLDPRQLRQKQARLTHSQQCHARCRSHRCGSDSHRPDHLCGDHLCGDHLCGDHPSGDHPSGDAVAPVWPAHEPVRKSARQPTQRVPLPLRPQRMPLKPQ